MSDYSDFKNQIAEWCNRQDWPDALVTSFVRMAEQKLNAELRVDRMIEFYEALVISGCAPLPDDWLELVSDVGVQIQNPAIQFVNGQIGFSPLRYMARDPFFALYDTRRGWTKRYYTLQGRQIYFGGYPDDVDGRQVKITYYGEVPLFSDAQSSWVYTKYPNLYLFAALMHADLHAVGEEQTAANCKSLAEDMIGKLNAEHLRAKASGSRVTRSRIRSFG